MAALSLHAPARRIPCMYADPMIECTLCSSWPPGNPRGRECDAAIGTGSSPRPWRPIEPAAFWSHVSVQSVSGGSDIPLAVFPLFYREPAPLPTHVRPRIPACIYGAALDWRTSYTALCLRFGGMEFRQTSRELRLFWPACSLRVRRRESKYSHALGPVSM
jgi:hypothetical protein